MADIGLVSCRAIVPIPYENVVIARDHNIGCFRNRVENCPTEQIRTRCGFIDVSLSDFDYDVLSLAAQLEGVWGNVFLGHDASSSPGCFFELFMDTEGLRP